MDCEIYEYASVICEIIGDEYLHEPTIAKMQGVCKDVECAFGVLQM